MDENSTYRLNLDDDAILDIIFTTSSLDDSHVDLKLKKPLNQVK